MDWEYFDHRHRHRDDNDVDNGGDSDWQEVACLRLWSAKDGLCHEYGYQYFNFIICYNYAIHFIGIKLNHYKPLDGSKLSAN